MLSGRACQGELQDLAGQAPSDSTNTSQFGHSTPWSLLHHLRPGLGSWGKDETGVIPIQGLTWMKQALVRSPRRAKELCRTSGMESWRVRVASAWQAPLPPTSQGPNQSLSAGQLGEQSPEHSLTLLLASTEDVDPLCTLGLGEHMNECLAPGTATEGGTCNCCPS